MATTTPSSKIKNSSTSGGMDLGGGGSSGSVLAENQRQQDRLRGYIEGGDRARMGVAQPGQIGYTGDQNRFTNLRQDIGTPTVTAADAAAGNRAPIGSNGGGGGLDPLTGFAHRYDPLGVPLLEQEPQAILADTLRDMGLSPNGGIFAQLAPIADQINPLLLLLQGERVRSPGDFINGANAFFQNMLTPGGNMVDYAQGLSRLLNSASLNQDSLNPLASFLNPRDAASGSTAPNAQQQVRNFMALYNPLLQQSTPLIMQGALQDQMNLIARDYISALAKGNMSGGNFVDYVHARQPFQGF